MCRAHGRRSEAGRGGAGLEGARFHLIGHLQSNKVKYIAHFVNLIHSVDSLGLLMEIDKQGQKFNKVVNCLLQVYIAQEETKFGLDEQELQALITSPNFLACQNIKIVGLMGMATFTDDENQIQKEFRRLAEIFRKLKTTNFKDNEDFTELSMGMSHDFEVAIEEGATMVRVGSALFEGIEL